MSHELSEYGKLERELDKLKQENEVPEWYIPAGYIMFKRKYAHNNETVRGAFTRIAQTLGKHYTPNPELAVAKFFDIMWKGFLAPSTPVMCNTGTGRGHSVSCSGSNVGDSIDEFYKNFREVALLSQKGYGTSSNLSDIRPRGSAISTGGTAEGVVPVLDSFIDVSRKVSQGNNRRGQWAGYLSVDHGDFWEVAGYILKHPAETNIGWEFPDSYIEKLKNADEEAIARWEEVMYIRSRHGKGYIWKSGTANRNTTAAIKASGIPIKNSNLCVEINLPANEEYTFSCVLSSLNLAMWDKFEEDTIFWSTVFLDCVVSNTLEQTEHEPGFEKIHKFTKDFRALGLGTLGWHSYLQSKGLAFESFNAMMENKAIFVKIKAEATRASQHLAEELGEPKWCEGLGMRNATLTAIAPNTSSALLCGGVSQGIEPLVANTFNQNTAAGEFARVNPYLLEVLKERGIYSKELIDDIDINFQGSIQHVEGLTEEDKLLFRTAFEMNQMTLVNQAAQRQPEIDQGQSLNLFFDTDEEYIATVTKEAVLNDNIKALYYQRSMRNVRAAKNECVACEG